MKLRIKHLELWLAALACFGITVLYVGAIPFIGIPPASGLVGHSLGIIGFILMLATEILYSLRKRYTGARYGKMSTWLSIHIFTGLVGPFMVLLHSSWKFNGLAGVVMLMTIIIVVSGFIGRYFYTAVPRSADGAVMELESLEAMEKRVHAELEQKAQVHPKLAEMVEVLLAEVSRADLSGSSRHIQQQARQLRQKWDAAEKRLPQNLRQDWKKLRTLGERQIQIKQQLARLSSARSLLAIWHTVHIPLGVVLFSLAFIHILGALYYATFLH
jgi:hypothetical protein